MFRPPRLRVRSHLTACAQMVHQGVVVLAHNDRNVVDTGVCHAGQRKVNQAVTSAERDGAHRALRHQFGNEVIIGVGENYAECIHIVVYHCSSPSFTSLDTIALGPTVAPLPMTTPEPTVATSPGSAMFRPPSGIAPTVAPSSIVTFSATMQCLTDAPALITVPPMTTAASTVARPSRQLRRGTGWSC